MTACVLVAAAALAAVRLVPDGVLGQTGSKGAFVDRTSCRSCAVDVDGNVALDGGWRIPAGGTRAERVPAGQKPKIVRESFANGFSADAVRFTVDTASREVVGWAADGKRIGAVFSYEGKLERPDLASTAAAYPKTGDLLIGTRWPECLVHRFRPDGTEVVGAVWPFRALAEGFAFSDGRVFAISEKAVELDDKFGTLSIGVNSGRVYGVARVKGGWWLATSQGAQFYTDFEAKSGLAASLRVGGLSGVTAVGLSGGRVIVASGYVINTMWLDDRRDEPFSNSHNWCSIGKWSGAVDSIVKEDDGSFVLHWSDAKKNEEAAWRFDPRITAWKDRKLRLHAVDLNGAPRRPANETVVMGFKAVAEADEIALYDGGRKVGGYSVKATALAAEGEWLVAYVPSMYGIVRFRVERR